MKLCIITPSFVGGGAERVAVNLANHYEKDGHEIVIIAFTASGPYLNQVGPNVRLIDLGASRIRYVTVSLVQTLKRERPNAALSVVRNGNVLTGLAAYLVPSLKIVFREANTMDGVSRLPLFKKMLHIGLMRLAYRRARKIIANSKDTADDLVRRGIVPASKIETIGNPVLPPNWDWLAAQAAEHPWLLDEATQVVLSVGRLHRQKNHALLIQAFSELYRTRKSVRLLILGEGEERDRLNGLVNSLSLCDVVKILPFQVNPYPFYKNSSVFVLSSDYEGFGNVLVEAMACGVSVICTDCPGGPKSILEGGRHGTLVPVGDLSGMAIAMENILDGRIESDLNEAKARALEFGIESVSKSYMRVLESV